MDLGIMSNSYVINLYVNDRQLWLLLGHLEKHCLSEGASYTFVVLMSDKSK